MGQPRHAPNVFGPDDQLHPEGGQFDPATWSASVGTGDESAVFDRAITMIVRRDGDPTIVSIIRGDDPLAGEILR